MRRAIYEDDVIKLLDKGWKSGVYPVASNIHALPSAQPELTDVQAIEHLQESGWMQNHDKQMYEMGLREQLADDSDSYDALLPSAQPEPSTEIQEILNYLDTTLHPIVSPDNWNVYAELHDMVSKLPSAHPGITKEYNLKKIYNIYVKIAQAHFVYQPSKPKTITAMPFDWIETQNLLEKYLEDHGADFDALCREYVSENAKDGHLPPAQPDIKQAAKLLSDFIESCPCGDSYLITPNGEELRTDWGYATEGIQLIHDWAERASDDE